jgi:hypothetical protein
MLVLRTGDEQCCAAPDAECRDENDGEDRCGARNGTPEEIKKTLIETHGDKYETDRCDSRDYP